MDFTTIIFFSPQEIKQMQLFDVDEYYDNLTVYGNQIYGLQDSPMALAAFVVERFRNATDCKGTFFLFLFRAHENQGI